MAAFFGGRRVSDGPRRPSSERESAKVGTLRSCRRPHRRRKTDRYSGPNLENSTLFLPSDGHRWPQSKGPSSNFAMPPPTDIDRALDALRERLTERFPLLEKARSRTARATIERLAPALGLAALASVVLGTIFLADRGRQRRPEVSVDPVTLVLPVAGLTSADVRDSFDAPRSGGRTHRAIDLMAPRGADVLAAADGTISRRYTSSLGGRTLHVTGPPAPDGERLLYVYAHLDRFARGLREGDRVAAGDVLGAVGSTGNAPSGAPHLHFAMRRIDASGRGEPVNPYPLLLDAAP